MADYILRDVDDKLWRKIKAVAALQGMSVKDLIIKLLEKEAKKLKR
jgi:predicted HicB family RNase H-like nuclease